MGERRQPGRKAPSLSHLSPPTIPTGGGAGDFGIFLEIPPAYTELPERFPDQVLLLKGTAVFHDSGRSACLRHAQPRFLCFSGPDPASFASDAVAVEALRNEKQNEGSHYLAALFFQHSTLVSGESRLLTPEGMMEIFSVTPSGKHPFGNIFPDCCIHNRHDALSLSTWLNLWT